MRLSNIALAISAQYGGLFKPSSLFTTGVNGAWYDPSDFSTMFQDAAGTTPVTAVGQPVGLMLDKSNGLVLGPELVTNGDFSNGTTGWVAFGSVISVDAGRLLITNNGALFGYAHQAIATTPGVRYRIEVDITRGTAGTAYINIGTSQGGINVAQFNSTISKKLIATFVATSATTYISPLNANVNNGTNYYDNISVRELPGNHAFNGSGNSANFPVLSARYNLLISTEDITSASWQKLSSGTGSLPVVTPGQTDPLGGTTAFRVRANRGAGNTSSDYSILRCSTSAVTSARRSLWVKSNTGETQTARLSIAVPATQISITTSWQLITNDSSDSTARFDLASFGTDGTTNDLDILIWHPDMRVPNDALNQPAYQRVNTATDYDTVGFKPYLSFNGVNHWLQTNSIDFTYGDKMFVAAGVRKLSDAAGGIVAELSAVSTSSAGSFFLRAPQGTSSDYSYLSSGSTFQVAVSPASYASPITNIVSGIGNISAPSTTLRVNGSQVAQNTTSQGTGNYGIYPLYIGARGGASLWLNGRLYGLVVAGKQASASEIASTESWLNQKTGAY